VKDAESEIPLTLSNSNIFDIPSLDETHLAFSFRPGPNFMASFLMYARLMGGEGSCIR